MIRALPLVLYTTAALAAPPMGVDPNGPVAQWVARWINGKGLGCCGIYTDCRPTAVIPNSDGNGYVAWISKDVFGYSAPDRWMPVPDWAFSDSGRENPSGVSWACWLNEVRCASLGAGG